MDSLFGSDENLSMIQMGSRALVMFVIALFLVRLGGIRILGRKSGVDFVIIIMLGAVLARGIVGASPFLSTVFAGFVMIIINKILAQVSARLPYLGNIVKGKPVVLYKNGKIQWDQMDRLGVSRTDLLTSLRLETNSKHLDEVDMALMEPNGRISFTLKERA
jgi:Predicted membrane protein